MRLALIAIVAALAAAPSFAPAALAQEGAKPAACAAMDASLPADLADWNGKAAIGSAPGAEHLGHAALTLGKGYEAGLLNTPKISYPVQPEKPGGSVAHGGLFEFTVETAGSYMVALGAAAWIDVIENGKAVKPASFGHGPECTSIRKMVVFALEPGKHTLQISANADPKMKILVAKKS
jgi:hypothetical protein